ncbi:transcription elongation factor GreA [Streptomyces olivoverticillatus]
MTQTSDNVTWLTQEAYDQLKAELDYLSGPARTEIAMKIAAAREEGDLRENGGYHAAKEEQGKQELRVRQLTQLLEHAKVGEAPRRHRCGRPRHGRHDRLRRRPRRHPRLPARLPRVRQLGHRDVLPQSPLGTGVNGKKIGEDAEYELPNGKKAKVRVLEAKPYRA